MRQKSVTQQSERQTTGDSGASISCPFCEPKRVASAVGATGDVIAIQDLYPVTQGHLLILPVRHTPDFFSMTRNEKIQACELIETMRREVQRLDPTILGFNVGVNCGVVAGQTVMHAHIHLIPRRAGDTSNPRGGVRGVIPQRMQY